MKTMTKPNPAPGNFFAALAPFASFNELVEDRHFAPVPEDWTVFVADIAGSTKAIESGRYKDVNTLGASCIVAAQNAMGATPFPYVFGGDGATMVVPPEAAERVGAALAGVRKMGRERFGMNVRVGAVKVRELLDENQVIEVARYRLVSRQTVAMFRGGGVRRAEELVKTREEEYALPENAAGASDLAGLSCRWQPIASEKGTMLSILVSARSSDPSETYRAVLRDLDETLGGDSGRANPVHVSSMSYRPLLQLLRDERRYHASVFSLSFLRRAFEIGAAVLVFGRGLRPPGLDADRYAAAMSGHADFRKFDDVLRMVVDCTTEQAGRVRRRLESRRRRGELHYGLHESADALMTCFVQGLEDGDHIHFVDGGDGGYALAAKELKRQARDQADA